MSSTTPAAAATETTRANVLMHQVVATLSILVLVGSTLGGEASATERGAVRPAAAATSGVGVGGQEPWRPDVAAARRHARSRQGEVAFAVIDHRGRHYGYHASQTAPAASVLKAMLLAAFLRMRSGRGLSARDRSLLGPMIRRSDSVAAT